MDRANRHEIWRVDEPALSARTELKQKLLGQTVPGECSTCTPQMLLYAFVGSVFYWLF